MSFDIFLQSFEQGQPALFPFSIVETAFQNAIRGREIDDNRYFFALEYPVPSSGEPETILMGGDAYPCVVSDSADLYCTTEPGPSGPATYSFMVNRPAAHDDFWTALLKILQTTHSALFWPGDNALVVGQAETIAHLPADMIETLGQPYLVSTARQIVERINGE
ncbi:hypothetical protein FJU30_19950 [Affinibrenneria salicis]|uniref:Uncharacterized protein n=1 Tax=Affinibrenneria salicis TaxID=2590031 RepID=A0A5J5FTU6_9GAMM|nr:hypothetical protein [Affinibrenneria salicis]KAA8996931.1 hypothetical protein FJU30_19950 [Affinibrenneria salicis]